MEVLKPQSFKMTPELRVRVSTEAKNLGYSNNKFVTTALEDYIIMIESRRPVIPQVVMMAKAAHRHQQCPAVLPMPKLYIGKKKR